MKVILAMVMSIDGKTTKWQNSNIYTWTSKEDQKHFFSLIEKSKVIIMGRKTFDSIRSLIKLSSRQLRIVLTKTPEKYADLSVEGQLEFTNDPAQELLKKLRSKGYAQALLVGGEHVNMLFFKAKLVNEVWLTIEPHIFGSGMNITSKNNFDIDLQLLSSSQLNKQGTLLLRYKVV